MTTDLTAVTVKCVICREVFTFGVPAVRYARWKAGEGLIQEMLPELNEQERELLISGICCTCFSGLFDESEEYSE